jgi:methylenetetrahydrofolate dehydrogenase (NADP+)/methenyltetrahydrofolate cyclohydrolase
MLHTELIDGAAVARRVREELAQEVAVLRARGIVPGLTAVLVGNDPASAIYVRNKERASAEIGMNGRTMHLSGATTQEELNAVVDQLNEDPSVHGILVQSPLPPQIKAQSIYRRIHPGKDVDGFHPENVGKVLIGDPDGIAPCTPSGVMMLLDHAKISLAGKDAVVIGRSTIVGKPMSSLLMQQGVDATVTICHSRTRDLPGHVRRADVVVAAIGRPEMVRGDWLKPGAIVIDVGINRVPDASTRSGYRLCGDVHFPSAKGVASHITPVPGGVGPMTIAMLLRNTVRAAARSGM